MTPLRKRMLEDLQIRNYSPCTVETYVRLVACFARHHGRSPDKLGTEDIRTYQVHVLEKKVSWALFNQTVCALRFLYRVTLQRDWPLERLPPHRRWPRLSSRRFSLPVFAIRPSSSSRSSRAPPPLALRVPSAATPDRHPPSR